MAGPKAKLAPGASTVLTSITRIFAASLVVCACTAVGYAREHEPHSAKALLQKICGPCHAVGATGRSPHPDAPPFRTFSDQKLYEDNLVQRLHDGLITGHSDMPAFRFGWDDAAEAVNYLKSIQQRKKAR